MSETKCTVIYTVAIISANAGAWYADQMHVKHRCILEIVDKSFGGQEIMFRVLNTFCPVKYIKTYHAEVVEQKIGTQKELLQLYGK